MKTGNITFKTKSTLLKNSKKNGYIILIITFFIKLKGKWHTTADPTDQSGIRYIICIWMTCCVVVLLYVWMCMCVCITNCTCVHEWMSIIVHTCMYNIYDYVLMTHDCDPPFRPGFTIIYVFEFHFVLIYAWT